MASAAEATACSSTKQQCAKADEITQRLKELMDMQTCNETSCSGGWSKFDNYCYKLWPVAGKSFEVAQQLCSAYGSGHLASIHSLLEEKFILGTKFKFIRKCRLIMSKQALEHPTVFLFVSRSIGSIR